MKYNTCDVIYHITYNIIPYNESALLTIVENVKLKTRHDFGQLLYRRPGSSSGIGLGAAEKFAACGMKVTITGRNIDGLKEARARCIANGLKDNDVTMA